MLIKTFPSNHGGLNRGDCFLRDPSGKELLWFKPPSLDGIFPIGDGSGYLKNISNSERR